MSKILVIDDDPRPEGIEIKDLQQDKSLFDVMLIYVACGNGCCETKMIVKGGFR